MRRDSPGSAAAAGEQAAQQLRKLESEMPGSSPDQKRTLGDEQLEAGRLASEQQRVADAAEKASKDAGKDGSDPGADARRRASARQEQLADRALKMRDAGARALGARMHEAADRMRRGDGKSGAAEARQIAGEMQQVAKRLGRTDGGAVRGETDRLADQLDAIRAARDRLATLERQLRDQNGAGGRGRGADATQLQQDYARELQRTRDMLGRLERGEPTTGTGTSTPEQHEWSRSAPGLESWKQDYGTWRTLSEDVARSLERAESSVAQRLSKSRATDRLRAGGSDRVPDAYRQRVARYFELLAESSRGGGGR
jgi:hypothetical protein